MRFCLGNVSFSKGHLWNMKPKFCTHVHDKTAIVHVLNLPSFAATAIFFHPAEFPGHIFRRWDLPRSRRMTSRRWRHERGIPSFWTSRRLLSGPNIHLRYLYTFVGYTPGKSIWQWTNHKFEVKICIMFPIKMGIFQPAINIYWRVSGADARIQMASFCWCQPCCELWQNVANWRWLMKQIQLIIQMIYSFIFQFAFHLKRTL